MDGKLLDTNAVIALQKEEITLLHLLEFSENVFLSSISIGELYFAALNSIKVENNLALIEELIATISVLYLDSVTSWHYAKIRRQLKQIGRPIPENDIWIAASAMQHELVLITDDGHFAFIDNLKLESWR